MKKTFQTHIAGTLIVVLLGLILVTHVQAAWSQLGTSNGLPSNSELVTAIGAANERFIIGTKNNGVFLSDDNGNTWRPPAGISPPTGYLLGISYVENRLIAGYAYTGHGVYVSDDNGENWQVVPTGSQINDVTLTSVLLGAFNGKIFIGSGGLYVSENKGETWQKMGGGLPVLGDPHGATAIGNTFFCTFGNNVYKSTDLVDWMLPAGNGLPTNTQMWDLVASGSNLIVYALSTGVYFSSDLGENWTQVTGLDHQATLREFLVNQGKLYASTGLFNYASSDNGMNWERLQTEFPLPTNMTALGGNSTTLIAGKNPLNQQGQLWKKEIPLPPVVPGDLNGSGSVDLGDTIIALRVLAGFNISGIKKEADVDQDAKIGYAEALNGL